jgi:hypothetical protein
MEVIVDDWDPKNGAQGNPRQRDTFEHEVDSSGMPGVNQLQMFLSSIGSDLFATNFRYWPGDHGRFSANRVENDNNEEDPNGRYLVDYDVFVETSTFSKPTKRVGHFGLRSIDSNRGR